MLCGYSWLHISISIPIFPRNVTWTKLIEPGYNGPQVGLSWMFRININILCIIVSPCSIPRDSQNCEHGQPWEWTLSQRDRITDADRSMPIVYWFVKTMQGFPTLKLPGGSQICAQLLSRPGYDSLNAICNFSHDPALEVYQVFRKYPRNVFFKYVILSTGERFWKIICSKSR
jgi:hypothetical protein